MDWAVLGSGFRSQLRNTFARPTFQFVLVFQPLVFAAVSFMIFRGSGRDLLPYVLAGSGLMNFWSSVVFSSAGDIDRERYMGNLEYLLVAPTPFRHTMLAKILGNTCLGLISLVLTAFYVRVVCGVPLRVFHPGLLLLALVLVTLSFVAVAMLMCAVFTLSRNARGLMNGLEYSLFLVAGFLFPVEALPAWVRPLSYLLLPTWAVKALRLALEPLPAGAGFWLAAGLVCILGAAYWALALGLFHLIERRVRMSGELGMY